MYVPAYDSRAEQQSKSASSASYSLQWALQQSPRGHSLLLADVIAHVTPCQSAWRAYL